VSRLIVEGGRPLRGSVEISGAKNSALAIVVAAALATEGECVLDNIPRGSDVATICQILQDLGAEVWYDDQDRLHVKGQNLHKHQASYDLVRRMRASFYSAGLLLARLGRAEVPLPGGCAIGV
jgi:UDP-N-acetylglucosamine 1-carboxyvinyltransferase